MMRNLNYATIILVGLLFVTISVQATSLRNGFNEYEYIMVNDIHIGKNVKAIWTLSYSDSEAPVTVVKRKTLEGIEYVVQSRYFAVSYVSSVNGFGAKEVRNTWSNVPKKINCAVICKKELANQALITPNKVDDKQALGLIASYLPELINDGYKHVLN
ncbi:hypothetical protein OU798_23020 [Prolixibacteraceae bacterium Z1-6]|uniref:Uncharacterized protein n=1 Tax=Draconibacterium aestuarii TaxID=2998507 RepID=A0A9X3J9Z0_9BACT|nr:hypothetical protein [Prolixibacteraceae bacterium Z1-6]